MIEYPNSQVGNGLSNEVLADPADELEIRWIILAGIPQWEAALAVAQDLVKTLPERCAGWLWRAQSLSSLNRTVEAWQSLLPAAERFPGSGAVAYDLCRYACHLGRWREACRWLRRALEAGNGPALGLLAADDPELAPLWLVPGHRMRSAPRRHRTANSGFILKRGSV